jgi:hypothetical protein
MLPRLGKTAIERSVVMSGVEIGSALHIAWLRKKPLRPASMTNIAGGEQQDATRTDALQFCGELRPGIYRPDERRRLLVREDFRDVLDLSLRCP